MMDKFLPSILSFDILDSTNDFIKKNQAFLPNYTIVQAMAQTHGKGQFERTWESEPGLNLLFSLLIKEEIPQQELLLFSASGIVDLLTANGIDSYIKPPNDIYASKGKIAGILIERLFEGKTHLATIIGIGLNVNQKTFHVANATSMFLETDRKFDVYSLLVKLIDIFKTKFAFSV